MDSGMGMAFIKQEGCRIHPDDPNHGYWGDDDAIYKECLEGYCSDNRLVLAEEVLHCRKPELWQETSNA